MEFVDTHCHLQFESLASRLDNVIGQARAASVNRLICVGTSLSDSCQAVEFAKRAGIWAACGVHPHEAEAFLADANSASSLKSLLAEVKVVAVGEIGLDFYKNYAPRQAQEQALRSQLEAGLPTGLPYIFHVRDAWGDFWRIFDDYRNLRGVVHSFSSGIKQLDAALSRGLHVGLNGIMTFTKDQAQLEAAKQVPLDKLLLETDAPFLAPAAVRGQICEPKHVLSTAEFLAKLRGEQVNRLAKATTANATRLFNLK